MSRANGYALWTGGEKKDLEADTFTCPHCNTVVFLHEANRKVDPDDPRLGYGFCLKCMKNICAKCADLGTCRPFERWLEKVEKDITAKLERERAAEALLGRR
jgi:hypothetical protein